jgi:endonuclease/exonuclease/phosphatase family metal-dependent hydrolase
MDWIFVSGLDPVRRADWRFVAGTIHSAGSGDGPAGPLGREQPSGVYMKRIRRWARNAIAGGCLVYLAVVVISNLLVGCEATPRPLAPPAAEVPPRLRVMTYNVNYSVAPDESAGIIRSVNPEVVFLQESNRDWEKFASSELADLFPHALFHHDQYAGGMGILSRRPIDPHFYEMPPMGWFNGWGVTIDTTLGPVRFLNVHLRPGASGQGGLSYLNVFRLSTIHPQEIEFLYRKLNETVPAGATVVLGDFNESDRGKAIGFLQTQGFTNALPAFDPDARTWHGRHFGIALSNRCDHILFSGDFRCMDAAVLPGGASDHRAVVADLVGVK